MLRQPLGVRRQRVEPTHGHDEASLGPRLFEGYDGERAALLPRLRSGLRHYGDTRAKRDHAAGGVQPTHPYARPHPPTRTCRVPGQVPAESAVAGEAHKLAPQRLRERDPPPARQHVATRRDQHQSVGPERPHL